MKFYLQTIQYNKDAHAENRTAPKMFENLADAEQAFYEQVGKDMKNKSLGGSINMVFNSEMGIHLTKKWGFMEETLTNEEVIIEEEN